LRTDNKVAKTVTFKVRYQDFRTTTFSQSLDTSTNISENFFHALDKICQKALISPVPIRQIGIKLTGISEYGLQLDLFESENMKKIKRDDVVDKIRAKFGNSSVKFG
jgi:hypothetical protein